MLAVMVTAMLFVTVGAVPAMAQTYDDSYYDYSYEDYEAYLDDAYNAYADYAEASTVAATGIASWGIASIALACCSVVVGLAIMIGMTYWVYKDAKKNRVENEILWAAITFFTGIIGLLIYVLAIRPEAVKKMGGAKPEPAKEEKKD